KREDRVEDMLKQSAGIYRSSMGERNPAYAKVISDLGNYYRYKGRYEEAGPLLQQALEIRQETLGELHPLYVQSQEDQAILHWKKKETAAAGNLYRKVLEQTLDFINRYFPPMSEAEKTRYWDLLAPRFERAYQFAIEIAPTDPSWLTDVLEYRMATKGLLLRSSRRITQSILGSGDTKLIQEYDQWLDNKEQLTALYAYSKEDLREQGINLDSLVDATNAMEKRLSEHSRDFAQFVFATRVRAAAVQQSLKADEALVEIIRYRHFDQVLTDSAGYAALILTKSTAVPKLVILPAGTELEGKAAKAYRLLMKNKAKDEQSYGSYWSPLEPELSGKKTLYVSPDGIYNQINLNTLRKPGGDFLINTYNIVLVGNPRDVTGTRSSAAPGNMPKTATLIGFPDYGSGLLVELPGTKVEVAAINKLLRSSGFSVSEWLQQDATETNLKRSHQVAILHIATHGYFLKDVERTNWPIGVAVDNARENVLLRSGLMLTGAAQAEKGAVSLDSSNNGIMTSYEAMNLDLQGTGLVVLSACETGLGDIKAGEGVYGLQRAFLAAGAQAVVMSLWKVDDNATQQLMNLFYANWVKGGNRQKAFRQAQQQLMTQFPEPLYWGAFILIEY
ncbi:MAG: hypothetical protein RJA57_1442, partial [Bacteroidota bacterium]